MSSKKAKGKRIRNDYKDDDDSGKPKKLPRTLAEKDMEKRLILILENASLETVKVIWIVNRTASDRLIARQEGNGLGMRFKVSSRTIG